MNQSSTIPTIPTALTVLTVALFAAAAGAGPQPKPETSPEPPATTTDKPAAPVTKPTAVPDGFIEMKVAGVMPTREGNAVMLTDLEETVVLPIWIGDSEAFSIQMRLDRRRFQRPLTHDLLDNVMRELGGRLIKIQVDDLKGNTYVGTIFVRQADRLIEIDARPSDAIALAVGNRVPIHVSKKVIERAGIRKDDLEKQRPSKPEEMLKDMLKGDSDEQTL